MQRTPLVTESLVVDLAGEYLWVDCENGYVSSSNRTLNCFGRECSKLQLSSRACLHKPAQLRYKSFMGCLVFPSNKLPDVVSTQSCINGATTGPYVTARKFSFGCGSTSLLKGLAKGVKGTNATAYYSSEYHIRVKSIIVGDKKVLVDNDSLDNGFIKLANINTMIPYTVLRTSIYNAFTNIFIEKAKALNITRVASVAPFGVCFDSKNMI
ncbi:hypothetical protein MKW92_017877, partial [Papaver armeniacum]